MPKPALKVDGQWHTGAQKKADAFVDAFAKKNVMDPLEENNYSRLNFQMEESEFERPTEENVSEVLQALDESSATGPDLVPTRILKQCYAALSLPILMLICSILDWGKWPQLWKNHWICPLYKKKAQSDPNNYRGVHLTGQISKVAERVLAHRFVPDLVQRGAFGINQFAYMAERGARDALAFLTLSWIDGWRRGFKFAVYCSDVSGAFDKVNAEILFCKLTAYEDVGATLHAVLCSQRNYFKKKIYLSCT